MQSLVNKFLSPAIGSTTTLIHVFIILLFFENFFIITESKSLLDVSIDFKNVALAPFIYFFFFLAVSKLCWVVICLFSSGREYKKDFQKTSAHKSFVTFILAILAGLYLALIENYPVASPIDINEYYWSHTFYKFFWLIVVIFSSGRFIFFYPESYTSEKRDVESKAKYAQLDE